MKRLLIIGNGFDIFHGMKTSYEDFEVYFERNDKYNYDKFVDLYQCYKDKLWNHLEKTLGRLDYNDDLLEKCGSYLYDDYISEHWSDSNYFDFQYEINEYLCTLDALKMNMIEWIKQIDYPKKKLLRFKDNDEFLTFNYTLTLEKIYLIDKDKVFHIHNKVGEDIILGHDNKYCSVTLDHHNPDHFDFRVQESIKNFNLYMSKYGKNTSEIIENNINRLSKKYDEIIVIGHSMSDVDFDYYRQISKNNSAAKWTIVYHSVKDRINFQARMQELNIVNYALISDFDLPNYLD